MVTRLKEWMIPYTAGDGIDISENHVISVLLREANNLIHINENREMYVDLQLDDWIQPDDDFPVWVTTWKILQADWWPQSWLILNWKTTSWDYARLIHANDGNLYVDLGDGNWILIWFGEDVGNVKAFFVESTSDLTTWQAILEWYLMWKYPLIRYNGNTYVWDSTSISWQLRFINTFTTVYHSLNNGTSNVWQNRLYLYYDQENQVTSWWLDVETIAPTVIATNISYQHAFNPTEDYHPATKKYVDDGLALKQDKLTAWTRITIDPVTNVISADMSSIFVYKWNVTDPSDLPSSWQQVWDAYFSESDSIMYAWDGTQWKDIWSIATDLSNFFDKTVDDSDDITQGTTNLFVTTQEKNYWNSKQDALTAWTGINIDQNDVISATPYTAWDWISINNFVISNTDRFVPENQWVMWYFLKKTSTWYAWAAVPVPPSTTYTAWYGIDITNGVITNEKPFEPTNWWQVWYVLKKSWPDSYYWAPESWGGWWWWSTYTAWEWIAITNDIISNTHRVKLFDLSWTSDLSNAEAIYQWLEDGNLPVIRYHGTFWYGQKTWDYFFYPVIDSISGSTQKIFHAQITSDNYYILNNWIIRPSRPSITFTISWGHVSTIRIGEDEAARCETAREWIWTQSEFNQLWSYEQWKIYNILAN